MANYKAQIAEALFEPSVKLSKEALLWAMSNLPDGEKNGEFSSGGGKHPFKFDHSQDNVWEGMGLQKDQLEEVAKIMSVETKKAIKDENKVTQVIENIFDRLWNNPIFIAVVTVKTVQDALEHAQKMSKLLDRLEDEGDGDMEKFMKIMKMIEKLKGKDSED